MGKISILGCGWLGTPLTQSLLRNRFLVKGSSTTQNKAEELKKKGVQSYCFTVTETGNYPQDFFDSDRLVITLPFRRHLQDPFEYMRQMQSLVSSISNSPITHIIFTSSTGVYSKHSGHVTENTPITPTTDREAALLATEQVLLKLPVATTICRLAGLIGPNRMPGKFLSGKQNIPNPNAPVNLIWQSDCIEIFTRLLQNPPYNGILNCVSDDHPSRKEFYTRCAQEQGIPIPHFSEHADQTNKWVDNQKVKDLLSFLPRGL